MLEIRKREVTGIYFHKTAESMVVMVFHLISQATISCKIDQTWVENNSSYRMQLECPCRGSCTLSGVPKLRHLLGYDQ